MAEEWHRTKRALVDTVVNMLDEDQSREPTCDAVLDRSGVSRGSLYHFFEDYADLVEHAEVVRFARYVDQSIAMLQAAMAAADSPAQLRESIEQLSRITQDPQRSRQRSERLAALAHATRRPRLWASLGREQQRLTAVLAGVIRSAQDKGWAADDFDPEAAAVLVQAYTIGRVVDDISPRPVDPEAWSNLILMVVDRVFGVDRYRSGNA